MNATVQGQAPEIPSGLRWLRTDKPLTFAHELAGRVVVLHFWTPSCVHSQIDLATLAWLQQLYAGEALTVVGVHVGKFARERWPANVDVALSEFGVRHPVVIDDSMQAWRAFGCASWPTLVLVDGQGRIRFRGAGEARREHLAAAVGALLREQPPGSVSTSFAVPALRGRATTELAHPSKCVVDPAAGLLWVSDTRHHRVLAFDVASGRLRHRVGEGLAGAGDGVFASASFCMPRGLACSGPRVYVADTGNGLIRVIDVTLGTVTTLLGTNENARPGASQGVGVELPLSAPWDVAVDGEELVIAMAGTHQLWRMDLATRMARLWAGTGNQGCRDGALAQALFAQPSGLALAGRKLAVVDAATSAVRVIDLDLNEIATRVGGGPFRFGDLDGPRESALLQQPLAVAWHGDDLLVADTLNGKVKRIAAATGRCETILGPIALGSQLAGLAVAGDTLFVTDTTDHRILRADLAAGRVAVFPVSDLSGERSSEPASPTAVGPVVLCARGSATLKIELAIPMGESLHPDAPLWAELENEPGGPLDRAIACSAEPEGTYARIVGVPIGDPGEGSVRLRLRYLTCRGITKVAHLHELLRTVRIHAVEAGPDAATL